MAVTSPGEKSFLIVGDTTSRRELRATSLRRQGHFVATVASGHEGLVYLGCNPIPDLILLDMLLPDMDGWTFLWKMSRNAEHATIPFVSITGQPVASSRWATNSGDRYFIRKSLDPDLLLKEVLRHAGGP